MSINMLRATAPAKSIIMVMHRKTKIVINDAHLQEGGAMLAEHKYDMYIEVGKYQPLPV